MLSLGYYFHSIVALLFEQRKKDFWQMMIHHVATSTLIILSWWISFFRIGSVILLLHDVADPWMEMAKMANYTGRHAKLCDTLFVVFTIAFGITRLLYYPLFVLNAVIYRVVPHPSRPDILLPPWCTYSETPLCQTVGPFFCGQCSHFGAYTVFVVLLLLLQVLHVIWYYMILRIAYEALAFGGVQKDVRSDPDVSEGEEWAARGCSEDEESENLDGGENKSEREGKKEK